MKNIRMTQLLPLQLPSLGEYRLPAQQPLCSRGLPGDSAPPEQLPSTMALVHS